MSRALVDLVSDHRLTLNRHFYRLTAVLLDVSAAPHASESLQRERLLHAISVRIGACCSAVSVLS